LVLITHQCRFFFNIFFMTFSKYWNENWSPKQIFLTFIYYLKKRKEKKLGKCKLRSWCLDVSKLLIWITNVIVWGQSIWAENWLTMASHCVYFAYSLPKAVQGLGNLQRVQWVNNKASVALLALKMVQGKDATRASSSYTLSFVFKFSELTQTFEI